MQKKRLYLFWFIGLLAISNLCAQSTTIKIIDFKTLQSLTNNNTDTTYVINFFASWCKPCLKELPEFIEFANNNHDHAIKVIFVSLDFKSDSKALESIINKYNITQSVYLLDEPNANKWINAIDPTWSGAIPATLITNSAQKRRTFIEDSMTYDTLNQLLK